MTFNNQRSYLKAVTAAFVEIKTTKFTKKVSGQVYTPQVVWGPRAGGRQAAPVLGVLAASLFFLPFCFAQVQIDPYLEDSLCHICSSQPGPFFCRDQVSPLGTWGV